MRQIDPKTNLGATLMAHATREAGVCEYEPVFVRLAKKIPGITSKGPLDPEDKIWDLDDEKREALSGFIKHIQTQLPLAPETTRLTVPSEHSLGLEVYGSTFHKKINPVFRDFVREVARDSQALPPYCDGGVLVGLDSLPLSAGEFVTAFLNIETYAEVFGADYERVLPHSAQAAKPLVLCLKNLHGIIWRAAAGAMKANVPKEKKAIQELQTAYDGELPSASGSLVLTAASSAPSFRGDKRRARDCGAEDEDEGCGEQEGSA